jgi:fructokinase
MWRVGVDVGGTKIESLALTPEGLEHRRIRIPAPRGDYDATLDAITTLVHRCVDQVPASDVAGVGLGIPGSLSPRTGLLRNANSTWLNGRAFGRDLQRRLPWPLVIENDANCFAVSEATDGAGAGYRVVFGVILGTGVGGGLAIERKSLLGRNAVAGEWGHNPLPWLDDADLPGDTCYCGRRGCIETYLSGPAFERQYARATGVAADARTIASRAEGGEEAAAAAVALYTRRLAKALAVVINIADPDIVVLGGGMSNITAIYQETEKALPSWVFSDCCSTQIVKNKWGDSSGVRGAAWLTY